MSKETYHLLGMKPSKDSLRRCTEKIDSSELEDETGAGLASLAVSYSFCIHLGFKFLPEYISFVKSTPPQVAMYIVGEDFAIDGWYWAFTRGLLLSLLAGDDDSLQQLCDWSKPKVKRDDYCPADEEELLAPLIVASLFQKKPSTKFRQTAEKFTTSRKREFKLLGNAIIALHERDQESFVKSVQEHVQIYQKKPLPQVKRAGKIEVGTSTYVNDWLSLPMNIIYLAGLKLGLADPKFPKDIMAYLITPQSAKLAK